MEENITNFGDFLKSTLIDYASSFANVIKLAIGAIVILLIGWIIAKLISKAIKKLLEKLHFAKLVEKSNLQELFGDNDLSKSVINVISNFVFYFIMLIFLLTATDSLGMQALTDQVNVLINVFPKILVAVVIFVIGFYVCTFIRDIISTTMRSTGSAGGAIIANVIFYFLLIIVSITAIEQIGVDTSLLSSNLTIIIVGIIIGGAISYGFAAKDVMGNILSTFFAKRSFKAGMTVRIGDVEGQIIEIDSINIVILSDEKRVVIPTQRFISENVTILNEPLNMTEQ